jgi:hypothetical protein
VIAVSIAVVSLATSARAQDDGNVAVVSCQTAAGDVIRAPLPESDSMLFAPNPRVSQNGKQEVVVEGDGEFQHRKGSSWHRFTFQCTYDFGSGETGNVKVQFAPNGGKRNDSRRVQRHPPPATPKQQGGRA